MHNCGTCKKFLGEYGIDCADFRDCEFSEHASELHPCAHGSPVVASAVAGVTFSEAGNNAHHMCGADGETVAHFVLGKNGAWFMKNGQGKYCHHCGLLLPTADQLQQMYERHKAEQEGRYGDE